MTEITYWIFPYKEGTSCFELRAEGHATGSSDVCAAVSGILYGLAAWVLNSGEAESDEVELKPGHALLRFSGKESTEAVFLAAILSLQQIADKYGTFLRVEGTDKRKGPQH